MINEQLAEQLAKLDLDMPVCSRRDFLYRAGGLGLGLTAAMTLLAGGRSALAATAAPGLTVQPPPPAPPVTVAQVLNFALNLEYLEAEFYSYALTGTTSLGKSTPYGAVSHGPSPDTTLNAPTQLTFPAATGALNPGTLASQIAADELSHVALLQQVLGAGNFISKPRLDLGALNAKIAALPGAPATSNAAFPFFQFLVATRSFEDTGASAYTGASTLVKSNATVLQTAAQILGVETYHAQSARVLLALNNFPSLQLDPIDQPPPPTGTLYFDVAVSNGLLTALTVTRTVSQVLGVVYGASTPAAFAPAGVTSGGFFPLGVNGAVKST